jgi:hypothetical protein
MGAAMKTRTSRKLVIVSACAAALFVLKASAQISPFTYSYEANQLPQSPLTIPQWTKVLDSDPSGPNTSETVSNGILTVYTANKSDYLEYRMDGGAGLNWNPTGAGSTLEVRLKTDFNAASASWAGNLVIGTGSRGWTFGIGTNVISDYVGGGGDLALNTSDGFHTLRFTLLNEANGPLAMYVDNQSIPAKIWPGASGTTNRLGFGDVTSGNEGGQIQWDYLRWTNNGRFVPDGPAPKSGEAGFGKRWQRQHPFTVMGEVASVTPGGYAVTPFDPVKYRGMGMNTVFVAATQQIAGAAQRAGLDWHMMWNIGPSETLTDAMKTQISSLISRGHATGWYLPDEPSSQAEFNNIAGYARWMNSAHPDLLTYVNTADTSVSSMTNLVNTVRPDALWFDAYPFSSSGTTSTSSWFAGLMNVRSVSQAKQIPYGGWLQSFHLSGWNLRTPSESDTRFNAYTLLTAGFTMLNYYIYDDGPYVVTSTFLDSNGNPTPTYTYTATANREYTTLGKTLRFLSSTDVRFVPGKRTSTITNSTPSGLSNWASGAGGDAHIQSVSVDANQFGADKNGLIGFFYDDKGESYFMLTNLNHGANLSAAATSVSFTIAFDASINEILRLNRTTGVQELLTLTNHTLNWNLPGGTGDLFKYNTGDFIGNGWCMDASGDWSSEDNWLGGIPNGVNAKATLGDVLLSPRTIYADNPVTVGNLQFACGKTYQITGNGSLAIDVSSGVGTIGVLSGTHKINLPLFVNDSTVANIAAGAKLQISDPMTLVGPVTLTKTGAGTLSIEAPVYHASPATIVAAEGVLAVSADLGTNTTVDVQGGTIEFSSSQRLGSMNVSAGMARLSGVTSMTSLEISGDGQVDLGNGKLIVDYTGASALAQIAGAVDAGNLNSSLAAGAVRLGYGEASDLFSGATGTFAGRLVDSSSVIAALTVAGDASLDGAVNSTDFNLLSGHFGQSADSRWTQGDFDGDGKITTIDFNVLAGQFGQTMPVSALGTVVPEPSIAIGAVAVVLMGRRKHS